MAYLILMSQERTANVVETPEDVCRATLSFLPLALVEDWLVRAGTSDVLQDSRFGRCHVIKLGDITDASAWEAKRVAADRITDALASTTDAVNALRGTR